MAQILAAATFPEQVVEADRWVQANPDLKGDALGKTVDQQPWDPSVKALTAFPSVLGNMDKNLSWASSLGDAYGIRGGSGSRAYAGSRSANGSLGARGGVGNRPSAMARPFDGNSKAARGYAAPRGQSGVRSGAFSGYSHGGQAKSYSSRGSASMGAAHAGGGGVSHAGGGGGHGGGGHR